MSGRRVLLVLCALMLGAACSGGNGASSSSAPAATPSPGATGTATPAPMDARLSLQSGFAGQTIAKVPSPRELAALPNGDLLVGTLGTSIYIVPGAEAAGVAEAPSVFISLAEGQAQSVVLAPNGALYAATETTIWKIAYTAGDRTETTATAIAHVRTGPVAPNSDGDVHRTTSVAATSTTLYAGVGSSCNACIEADPTRATVQRMGLDGANMTTLATRSRNPIALAVNPATGNLWIGGAGQDRIPYGHPYEYIDPVTAHGNANVDYGWPQCEENHVAYNALGTSPAPDCSNTVQPAVEFPAYASLIGATFYPANQTGAYVFPAAYRGGLFVTSHGSWHCCPSLPPRVYFVAMNGDTPVTPVNWSDPTAQAGAGFISGFGDTGSTRYIARPTGIAVGSRGSLFIADGLTGNIIRIRPVR